MDLVAASGNAAKQKSSKDEGSKLNCPLYGNDREIKRKELRVVEMRMSTWLG